MTNVFTFTFDQKTPYHTKIPLAFKEYDHPDEKILLNESFFTFWDFRGDGTAPNLSNIVSLGIEIGTDLVFSHSFSIYDNE